MKRERRLKTPRHDFLEPSLLDRRGARFWLLLINRFGVYYTYTGVVKVRGRIICTHTHIHTHLYRAIHTHTCNREKTGTPRGSITLPRHNEYIETADLNESLWDGVVNLCTLRWLTEPGQPTNHWRATPLSFWDASPFSFIPSRLSRVQTEGKIVATLPCRDTFEIYRTWY